MVHVQPPQRNYVAAARRDSTAYWLGVEAALKGCGALEFFEYDFVHARAGVDQRGGDDRLLDDRPVQLALDLLAEVGTRGQQLGHARAQFTGPRIDDLNSSSTETAKRNMGVVIYWGVPVGDR